MTGPRAENVGAGLPQLVAEPVGARYALSGESDISEMSFGPTGLRVVLETQANTFRRLHLEFHFAAPRGFRFLDEGDLGRYWDSKAFLPGFHLFKISSGGWLAQELEVPGMLSTTQAVEFFQEWFIATTNGCLTVLSVNEPQIREFNH